MSASQSHSDHGHGDTWHQHGANDTPQQEHGSKIQPGVLINSIVLIIGGTVGLMAITLLYFNYWFTQTYRERTDISLAEEYNVYKAQADEQMATFRWADVETGKVALPIDLATERVMKKYSAQNQAK